MENLSETKPISKLVIEIGGDEYVFAGGGGVQPGVPLPADVVDTDAIIDGAVEMQDLHDDVKGRLTQTYSEGNRTLYINGAKPQTQDIGQGGSEDSDDEGTGFDTGADSGDDDV